MIFKMLVLNFISLLFLIIMVMVGVAYFTLLERKILGYIQDRKGPNKVGFLGIFQPFSDAIKLFTNELFMLLNSKFLVFYLCPVFSLTLSLLIWIMVPYLSNLLIYENSLLILLCLMSLTSYPIMIGGWSSNSNYSMFGSIRGVCQVISYEACLFLMFFTISLSSSSLSIMKINLSQEYSWNLIYMFPLWLIWMILVLIETNRTPFDLVEGESELVSGFNTEYFSGVFGFIFMAEYSSMMFMSYLTLLLFSNLMIFNLSFYFLFMMIIIFIIWIRGVLPRIRYDQMMYLCWKNFLMILLMYLFYIFGISVAILNFLI